MDEKNKGFNVKTDLKVDSRLTDVFLKMGVIDQEDVTARKSSLKDSEENVKTVTLEDVIKSQ